MKYVLCYGDSNTWGAAPKTFKRYSFDERWTGVMQNDLGKDFHVYENALNGRTTVFEDPIEEGRCGKEGFYNTLEENSPLDLIIIMLGTNDLKLRFKKEPWDIGWGIDLLIKYVKKSCYDLDEQSTKILIASPIILGNTWEKTILGTVFDKTSTKKSEDLAKIYEFIAEKNNCYFFDASKYAQVSDDCVHLSVESHASLGLGFSKKVMEILK